MEPNWRLGIGDTPGLTLVDHGEIHVDIGVIRAPMWRYIRDKEHSRALLHIIYYNVRRAEVGGDGPGGDIDVEKGRSSSRT